MSIKLLNFVENKTKIIAVNPNVTRISVGLINKFDNKNYYMFYNNTIDDEYILPWCFINNNTSFNREEYVLKKFFKLHVGYLINDINIKDSIKVPLWGEDVYINYFNVNNCLDIENNIYNKKKYMNIYNVKSTNNLYNDLVVSGLKKNYL